MKNALFFGGSPSGSKGDNRYWNGSSWTELGDLNTARLIYGGGSGKSLHISISFWWNN